MKVGKDVRIHKTAIIKRPKLVSIGNHVAVDPFFYMTTGAKIGNWCHIGSHVSVIGGEEGKLIMKDYVAISTGCRLICSSNDFKEKGSSVPFDPKRSKVYGKTIVLEKYSVLGAGCIVLPDVRIKEGSAIGAGAVVLYDTVPWGIYAGVPARLIGFRE